MISIPDVRDVSQRQAVAVLNSLGFKKVETKWVEGAYRDLVVGLEYRGRALQIKDKVPADAILTLLVSSGNSESEQADSLNLDGILIPDEEIEEESDTPLDF
jgi:hypothetical protein